MGISDLHKEDDHSMYAGGEKSGMAIEGSDNPHNDIIRSIFEQAQRGATHNQFEEDEGDGEETKQKPFQGRAQRLREDRPPTNTDHAKESQSNVPKKPTKVARTLTFWRNGFAVSDSGPLYEYHIPENQRLLAMLQSGRAPLDLWEVEPGQVVDIQVAHRMSETFAAVQPHVAQQFFSGKGQRLGDLAEPVSVPSQLKPREEPATDRSKPTTSLQLRFADGTRMNATFNTTATVADIYEYVRGSSVQPFVLLFGRPLTTLDPKDQRSLQETNLLNTVIMQQWQ